jgi:hypothetical protein
MPRRMTRRVAATAAATAAAILAALPAARAAAGPGSGGGTGSAGSDDGVISAIVTVEVDGSEGSGSACTWERVDGPVGAPELGSVTYPYTDAAGTTFSLWKKNCPGQANQWFIVPETDPEDLLPRLLEQLKSTRLPDPEPSFLALDPTHNWAYVTVPVDFRAGGDSLRTVSVSASIGPVWATVTAVPTGLTFDPGDPNGPGPVTCAGEAPVAGYDPAVPGECSYTYRNASSTSTYDGYHFVTTTSIDWSITWASSTGAGGTLEPYATSATALLAVAEVQGLVTCTGSRGEQGGC